MPVESRSIKCCAWAVWRYARSEATVGDEATAVLANNRARSPSMATASESWSTAPQNGCAVY